MTNPQRAKRQSIFQSNPIDYYKLLCSINKESLTLYIFREEGYALRKDLQEAMVLSSYLESIQFPWRKSSLKINLEYGGKVLALQLILLEIRTNTFNHQRFSYASGNGMLEKEGFKAQSYPTVYHTNDEMVSPSMFFAFLRSFNEVAYFI